MTIIQAQLAGAGSAGSKKIPRLMWQSLYLGDYIPANTITPGGATGSAASPCTVAVTGAQTTRSAATPGELQAVPPKPLLLVQQFGQCQHGDQRGRSSFSPYLLK